MKKTVPSISVVLIFTLILAIFWYQELQYLMPTPVPKNYLKVPMGADIVLDDTKIPNKAFVHFFNSECPCSRFNLTEFNRLVETYHQRIPFFVVTENAQSESDLKKVAPKIHAKAKLLLDADKRLAKKMGVYSSPQAAILQEGKLFYRGNYNRTRYCTDKRTNYAQIALDAMLAGKPLVLDERATQAYGCQLPDIDK